MGDDKSRAFIRQQATVQAKKKLEEGVPPSGGTGPLKSFIKRKTTDKVNCPVKKPKVDRPTVRETPPISKLPPPPHHGKRERFNDS